MHNAWLCARYEFLLYIIIIIICDRIENCHKQEINITQCKVNHQRKYQSADVVCEQICNEYLKDIFGFNNFVITDINGSYYYSLLTNDNWSASNQWQVATLWFHLFNFDNMTVQQLIPGLSNLIVSRGRITFHTVSAGRTSGCLKLVVFYVTIAKETWRRIYSPDTRGDSALELLRNRAL